MAGTNNEEHVMKLIANHTDPAANVREDSGPKSPESGLR